MVATWSEWDGTSWAGDAPQLTSPVARAGVPATSRQAPPIAPVVPLPFVSSTTAIALSAVWRAVDLIASTVASFPWQEWRGDPMTDPTAVQLQPSRLARKPMATMTRREWTWRVVAAEALENTVYLLHTGGRDSEGTPWSLLPLPPGVCQAASPADPWGLVPAAYYRVGGLGLVPSDELTIIRRAPFPGLSDAASSILQVARRQFQAYLGADTHMARYWTNGGPTTTVLTTDQELDDNQADTIQARWDAKRSMSGTAVLGKGVHAEPWGADPTSESATEARREIVAELGRYFGLPTRILNAPAGDSETYSNVESDRLDLLGYCLQGYMDPLEDAVSENLPGDTIAGRHVVLDPTRWLQGALAERATAWSALVAAGIVTVPEARVRGFGLAPGQATVAANAQADALPGGVVTVAGDAPAPMEVPT